MKVISAKDLYVFFQVINNIISIKSIKIKRTGPFISIRSLRFWNLQLAHENFCTSYKRIIFIKIKYIKMKYHCKVSALLPE